MSSLFFSLLLTPSNNISLLLVYSFKFHFSLFSVFKSLVEHIENMGKQKRMTCNNGLQLETKAT